VLVRVDGEVQEVLRTSRARLNPVRSESALVRGCTSW
jgi:hypothetical protein